MKFILVFLILVGSVFSQRPIEPWVAQVSIKERARQLAVALHNDLWVMYDLPWCAFYLAWKGGATGGALIEDESSQDPHTNTQFNPSGTQYFKQDFIDQFYASTAKEPAITNYYNGSIYPTNYRAWKVEQGETKIDAQLKYKGYFVNEQVSFKLNFSLILPGGQEISITEEPEYVSGGQAGLTRKITISGIPSGYKVLLHIKGGSSTWSATGKGALSGDDMIQSEDGVTTLSASW
ncbi:MAG: hypothetical protein HQK83_11355 [Fibrobacteria bacterium]|nr:hypothetical protein [Fibrobacteria bacterium]